MPPQHDKQDPTSSVANRSISPHNSSTPLIPDNQRHDLHEAVAAQDDEKDPKTGKRRLFGLAKKRDDKQQQNMNTPPSVASGMLPQTQAAVRPPSPLKSQPHPDLKPTLQSIPLSPARIHHNRSVTAQSPSRLRSSSPRLHSPASSEIFERNVQEPIPLSGLGGELSPAHIPSHVMTEDQIPPALQASAEAITNDSLNPDEVEIVTSSTHQPASSVLEGSASHADLTQLGSAGPPSLRHEKSEESEPASSLHASGIVPGMEDDSASNYGQLDPNDVRRLSFISFKDIVQSEHQHFGGAHSALSEIGNRESLHIGSPNLPSATLNERATSPLRSPRSPLSASPPPVGGAEQSPVRSVGLGSPGSQHAVPVHAATAHGELTIETMRQALRKTASGDLSNVRSAGMSPVSDEATSMRDAPRSRTNT